MTDQPRIADRIPHSGDMVLIHRIVAHDAHRIHCRSRIATAADHPLACAGTLPASALLEYGAQAMALHGGLNGSGREPPRIGYLASLARLRLHGESIPVPCELDIRAHLLAGTAAGARYEFEVRAGQAILADGLATVAFPGSDGG